MSSTLGVIRSTTLSLLLSVATLALASGEANAQFPEYGWDYSFPDRGFGGSISPYGYGMTGFDYGMSGFAYPGMASGYDYGMGGFGYGVPDLGYPGISYGYGVGQAFGDGDTATAFPFMDPLFGVGTTPLGGQSLVTDSNRVGRRQLAADRRARARNLRRPRGR